MLCENRGGCWEQRQWRQPEAQSPLPLRVRAIVYVQIHTCVCVYTCIWKSDKLRCCSSGADHLFYFKHLSLAQNLPRRLGLLANEPQGVSYLYLPALGLQVHTTCTPFLYMGFREITQVPVLALHQLCYLPSSIIFFAQSPHWLCAAHQGSQLLIINSIF